jgi:hypothetical protein
MLATFTASGTPTSGSYTVTSSAAFGSVQVGQAVSGSGIPNNTYVTDVASTSSITISNAATSSPGSTTLTFGTAADNTYSAPTHAVGLLGGQGPRQVTDGATNSNTTVTSASAAFNSGDVGRPISGAGIPAGTVISKVVGPNNVTISQPATTTATGVTITFGGGFGTRVDRVLWIPNGTTLAGVLPLFLYSGETFYLRDAAGVAVTTPSSTSAPAFTAFPGAPYTDLWIPPGWLLMCSSTVASQLATVTAFGENF